MTDRKGRATALVGVKGHQGQGRAVLSLPYCGLFSPERDVYWAPASSKRLLVVSLSLSRAQKPVVEAARWAADGGARTFFPKWVAGVSRLTGAVAVLI